MFSFSFCSQLAEKKMRLVCFLDVLVLKVRSSFLSFFTKEVQRFPILFLFLSLYLDLETRQPQFKGIYGLCRKQFSSSSQLDSQHNNNNIQNTQKKLCIYICIYSMVYIIPFSIVESKYFSLAGKVERGRKRNRMEKATKIILCCM